MITNEKIFTLVKEKGPVLPVHISKEINDSILMASARLSELLSNKRIKISNLKVGGSPLYYVEGQENKLQNYSDNLPEKEKEAYELLKQNKILRDAFQEPSIRVALRQIKDFAVPLQVNYENKVEILWKWYLMNNNEAHLLIKDILSKKEEIKSEVKQETGVIKKETETLQQNIVKKPNQELKPIETKKETTQRQEKTIKPIEKQKEEIIEPIKTKETQKPEIKKERKKIDKGAFLREINRFFDRNKINTKETNEIKKNSEIDFVAELETTIGIVKYFCKSKNKKRISDGDLSSAFMQAQSKGLPLLFLTKGELTKKAKEMMEADKNNILFKKI